MDDTIINASSALIGAIIGGIAAYLGSRSGSKLQIDSQTKVLKDEKLAREKLSSGIIEWFLSFELKSNFLLLHNVKHFCKEIRSHDTPFNWGYNPIDFKFDEYDKVKYDLLGYLDNEFVVNTIKMYQSFEDINRYKNIESLSTTEFLKLKTVFLKLENHFGLAP